jgi:hypothetical protein
MPAAQSFASRFVPKLAARQTPARRTRARDLPLGSWENLAWRVHFVCAWDANLHSGH